jgi:hypothetical protein
MRYRVYQPVQYESAGCHRDQFTGDFVSVQANHLSHTQTGTKHHALNGPVTPFSSLHADGRRWASRSIRVAQR